MSAPAGVHGTAWYSPDCTEAELAAACDPTPPHPHAALIAATQALIRQVHESISDAPDAEQQRLIAFADALAELFRMLRGDSDSYAAVRTFTISF